MIVAILVGTLSFVAFHLLGLSLVLSGVLAALATVGILLVSGRDRVAP